ncbi:MAG: DUF6216 family protein [Acidovorax sp.]|nr:DUF6216 family protein [Acidovorax sp.]
MDFASITQFGGAIAAFIPLVLLVGFAVVVWRTVSLHSLLRRAWLLVHGNHEISDPAIRAYVDEQTNLMSFRMFSGVQASSLAEAHQLIQWAQLNRVDLRKVAACGDYFDTGLRQVRKHQLPSRPYLLAHATATMLFLIGALLCVWLMLIPQVPFTIKATQRSFTATEASAQTMWPPLFFNRQPLRKSDCEQPLAANAARTTFAEGEVETLCQMLLAKEWPEHLASKLKEQRWSLLACALFCLVLLVRAVVVLNRVFNAKELAARGLSPAMPGVQAELNFLASKD